jgi:hypothetical protein
MSVIIRAKANMILAKNNIARARRLSCKLSRSDTNQNDSRLHFKHSHKCLSVNAKSTGVFGRSTGGT